MPSVFAKQNRLPLRLHQRKSLQITHGNLSRNQGNMGAHLLVSEPQTEYRSPACNRGFVSAEVASAVAKRHYPAEQNLFEMLVLLRVVAKSMPIASQAIGGCREARESWDATTTRRNCVGNDSSWQQCEQPTGYENEILMLDGAVEDTNGRKNTQIASQVIGECRKMLKGGIRHIEDDFSWQQCEQPDKKNETCSISGCD